MIGLSRRVARIWKRRGGCFERVRKVQTTFTRIFIVFESVSHGLSENWDEICRKAQKFKVFFAQDQVVSEKKKGLHRNWDWFFGQNPKFKRFFRPKSGGLQKKKKKRSSPKLGLIFRPNPEIQTFEGGCFPLGGLFSIFHKNSASKAPKTCDFAYFTSQWGGSSPPRLPPGYATGPKQ